MDLGKSNIWVIFSLIASTILAPIFVWNMQQGKIEKLRAQTEVEMLELEKRNQLIELYEKLGVLMDDQRQLYDEYTFESSKGNGEKDDNYFKKDRVKRKISEGNERVNELKKMISTLNGKSVMDIKGTLPPLAPTIEFMTK